MGKSQRFKQLIHEETPGPNQYKLSGFADEIMKKTFNKTHMNKTSGEETKNNFFNKTNNTSKLDNLDKQSSFVSGKNGETYYDARDKEQENTISKNSDKVKSKKLNSINSNNLSSNKEVRVVSKHNSEKSLELNINNNEGGIGSEYFDANNSNKNNNKISTKTKFLKPSSNTIQSSKDNEEINYKDDVSSNKDSINV
jgi:hypothetical protein